MKKKKKRIALVEDPFKMAAEEIAEAQNNPDELVIDEDLADEKLERLENAMEESPKDSETEIEVGDDEELKQQIAEDLALEEEERKLQNEAEESDPILNVSEEELDINELQSCIEAILFISDRPVPFSKLRNWIGEHFSKKIYNEAIAGLKKRYEAVHHGFELCEISGGFQFRTKPGRGDLIKKLARVQKQRLSRGAMETLAIVAYKQPVLKEEIDRIRGVDSSHFVRVLLEKSLIQISGRSELPGRPIIYSTGDRFLEIFGLKDLQALPPLQEIEKLVPTSQVGKAEDPRIVELRKMVGKMHEEKDQLQYNPEEDERILKEIRERVKSISPTTAFLEELDRPKEEPAAEPEASETPEETLAPAEPELPVQPKEDL